MAKRGKRGERKAPRSLERRGPRSRTDEAPTPRVTAPAVVSTEDRPEADVVIVGGGAPAGGLRAFSQPPPRPPRHPRLRPALAPPLAPQPERAPPTLPSPTSDIP